MSWTHASEDKSGRAKREGTGSCNSAQPTEFTIIPPSSPPPSLPDVTTKRHLGARFTTKPRAYASGKRGAPALRHQRSGRHGSSSGKANLHAQAFTASRTTNAKSTTHSDPGSPLENAIIIQTDRVDHLQKALDQMGSRMTQELLAVRIANDQKIRQLSESVRTVLFEVLDTVRNIRADRVFKAGADGDQCLWNTEWGNLQGGAAWGGVLQAGLRDTKADAVMGAMPSGGSSGSETFWTADGMMNGLDLFESLMNNSPGMSGAIDPLQNLM